MKRMTKAQKEAAQKAALLQRVMDIYTAAMGDIPRADDCYVCPEHLCRIMCAIKAIWVTDESDDYLIGCWNVDEYESPEKLTDFLHRNGVRA
jgi:hypothetical protein